MLPVMLRSNLCALSSKTEEVALMRIIVVYVCIMLYRFEKADAQTRIPADSEEVIKAGECPYDPGGCHRRVICFMRFVG